jgi:formamidopyrimidine-DNA glycosylase
MPELPDLQVFSKNLEKILKGKKIEQVLVYNSRKVNVANATLRQAMEGAVVNAVRRDGKMLVIVLNNGHAVSIHLMLHGTLKSADHENSISHPIIRIELEGRLNITLEDWQYAAHVILDAPLNTVPDALSEELDYNYLRRVMEDNGKNIKTILLDQQIIRGIGNAYADEILWDARISPYSAGRKIPTTQVRQLLRSIKKVLAKAERAIKKAHPGIISGEVRDFLLIHNAHKEKSPDGFIIQTATLASRKTYFTDEQEVYV